MKTINLRLPILVLNNTNLCSKTCGYYRNNHMYITEFSNEDDYYDNEDKGYDEYESGFIDYGEKRYYSNRKADNFCLLFNKELTGNKNPKRCQDCIDSENESQLFDVVEAISKSKF